MFAVKPGMALSPRNLYLVLKERHDDYRAKINEEIARRNRDGIPLDDLADIGNFAEDEELKDLSIVVMLPSRMDVIDHEAAINAAGSDEGRLLFAVSDFVRKHVVEVTGLTDEDGNAVECKSSSDDFIKILDTNDLLYKVMHAARYLQNLPNSKKKNCGKSQPST